MNSSVRLKEAKSGPVRSVALPLTVRDALKAHRLAQAEQMLKLGVSSEMIVLHADEATAAIRLILVISKTGFRGFKSSES
jgi:hypothetical protein